MKISIIASVDANRSAGVGGVCAYLDMAFRRFGHACEVVSNQTLLPRYCGNVKQFLFAFSLLFHRRAYAQDVLDINAGDGLFLAAILKLRFRSRRPLLVARSHGLEHVGHNILVAQARAGLASLSWKYPIYHGGYRLWQVAQYLRMADLALFLSEFDRNYAVETLGVRADRAVIVNNGIPDSFIGRQVSFDPPAIMKIAMIGTFLERKGIRYAVPALNTLLLRNNLLEVGFFGVHVDPLTIKDRFSPEVRDRISVVESYRHDDLPRLLSNHHILLLASISEGFALASFEGMACGLALVATDIPGIAERFRHGENALIVPPRDHIAIEVVLQKLIDNPELLFALRSSGYRLAQNFSWSHIAQETIKLYTAHKDRL